MYTSKSIPLGHEQIGLWFFTSQFAPEPQTFGSGSLHGSLQLNLTQAWGEKSKYMFQNKL